MPPQQIFAMTGHCPILVAAIPLCLLVDCCFLLPSSCLLSSSLSLSSLATLQRFPPLLIILCPPPLPPILTIAVTMLAVVLLPLIACLNSLTAMVPYMEPTF